jgi:ribonuclease P protein component
LLSPGSARFPRTRRLVRRAEFSEVMKSAVRSRDECFSVSARADDKTLSARLGVTVAKRVSPKAVARNRIKRQIRESFRRNQQLLEGLSVVVTANPPAAARDNAQLRTSLGKHWERVSNACKRSRPES